jgi:hypothetical protein
MDLSSRTVAAPISKTLLRPFRGSVFKRLAGVSPTSGFFITFLPALLLLLLGYPLGLSYLDRSNIHSSFAPKQVGYANLPNWWLVFTVILPLAVFCLLTLLRRAPSAFTQMADRQMFVDKQWVALSHADGLAQWTRELGRVDPYAKAMIALAAVFSLGEWAAVSAVPLAIEGAFRKQSVDWAVAAIESGAGYRIVNALFSLCAFILQAVAFSALGVYLAFLIALWQFREAAGFDMIPDPRSNNGRKGFETLEPVLVQVFHVGLLTLVMLYLSRYSKEYLSGTKASFWDFVKPDLTLGILARSDDKTLDAVRHWSSTLSVVDLNEFGMMAVTVLGLVVAVLNFALPAIVLRNCAREGSERLQLRLNEVTSYNGQPSADAKASLEKMAFWPTSYVSSAWLWVLTAFAICCLFFTQLGPVILGIVVCSVVVRVAVAAAR